MKETKSMIFIWREGGYYIAQCSNINISSFGQTKQEALDNFSNGLELYSVGLNFTNL